MMQQQVDSTGWEGAVQRSLLACARGMPDSLMARVGAEARARVRVLKRLWSGGRLESSMLLLGVMLEPRRLYWVRATSWQGDTVRGRVAWAPEGETRHARGLEVWVREDEVNDFLLVRSHGRVEGGLLARTLLRAAPGCGQGGRARSRFSQGPRRCVPSTDEAC